MQKRSGTVAQFLTLPPFLRDRLSIADDAELPVGPRNEMGGVARSELGRTQM
jgi:hypothetical protein